MKLVLYFADAFAWKYVEDTDYMGDFFNERRPLETVLGYSSTILPVLVSGKMPRDTGIWTEYFRAERPQSRWARAVVRSRVFLTPVNMARLVLFRFARKAGSPTAHRLRVPLQLAHHFDRHDMDYRNFPPVALPVETIDQVCAARGLRFHFRYMTEGYDLEEELGLLRDAADDADVFFFYDPSIDGRGHIVGASAAALQPEMDRVQTFVERAWSLFSETDDPELFLFSDHGMTNVEQTFDIFGALGDLRVGDDYLVFVDSTFARFWYPNEEVRALVHERLADAPASFLTPDEVRAYGIDFDDDRYGQEILAIDEGTVFHPSYISPSFFRTKDYPDKATHGYRPEAPSAYGIFCYRGERLRETLPAAVPAAQVFSLATSLLDVASVADG